MIEVRKAGNWRYWWIQWWWSFQGDLFLVTILMFVYQQLVLATLDFIEGLLFTPLHVKLNQAVAVV